MAVKAKREDLILCHGTRQPVGNMVELEARANPNGEPIPALQETPGIWAADYVSLCGEYATDSGMVVGEEARKRFAGDTEGQIYHFDVPNAKVITLETRGLGLHRADRAVREALAEKPDVLRLNRTIGTEYIIVNPDAARLVRVTTTGLKDLPPGQLKLQEPSVAYCIAETNRLEAKAEKLRYARSLGLEGEEIGRELTRIAEANVQANSLEDNKRVQEQIIDAYNRTLALNRKIGPDVSTILANDFNLNENARQEAAKAFDRRLTELQDSRDAFPDWANDEGAISKPVIQRQVEDLRQTLSYLRMDYISFQIEQAGGGQTLQSSETMLALMERDRDYWEARCRTGKPTPTRDYCFEQRESAAAELRVTKEQQEGILEYLDEVEERDRQRVAQEVYDYRSADAEVNLNPESETYKARQIARERAHKLLAIAQERFDYWESTCEALEKDGPTSSIAESGTPYETGPTPATTLYHVTPGDKEEGFDCDDLIPGNDGLLHFHSESAPLTDWSGGQVVECQLDQDLESLPTLPDLRHWHPADVIDAFVREGTLTEADRAELLAGLEDDQDFMDFDIESEMRRLEGHVGVEERNSLSFEDLIDAANEEAYYDSFDDEEAEDGEPTEYDRLLDAYNNVGTVWANLKGKLADKNVKAFKYRNRYELKGGEGYSVAVLDQRAVRPSAPTGSVTPNDGHAVGEESAPYGRELVPDNAVLALSGQPAPLDEQRELAPATASLNIIAEPEAAAAARSGSYWPPALKSKSGHKPRGGGRKGGGAPAEIRRFAKQARK